MDKTWTWGELYATIAKLTNEHYLDPRFDCVINLFAGYSSHKHKIQEFIDGPLSIHREYDEVRLINDQDWYNDEFSVGLHPNGDILLGTEEMIEEYINDTCDDYEY